MLIKYCTVINSLLNSAESEQLNHKKFINDLFDIIALNQEHTSAACV
jgi:hypothetical protein